MSRELAVRDEKMAGESMLSAREIYQSVRAESRDSGPDAGLAWTKRIEVVAEIERVEGSTFHLKDGSTLSGVDVVVFATGYLYS